MSAPSKPFGRVVWNDAHTSMDQFGADEWHHEPAKVETNGYIIKSDEVGVSVAAEWLGDDYRNLTFIPRGMVVEESVVSRHRQRKKSAPPPQS